MGLLKNAARMIWPARPGGSWFMGRLGGERDYRGLVGDGSGSALALACATWVSNAFTQTRPVVLQLSAEDEMQGDAVPRHAAARLVRRPTYDPDLKRSFYSWHVLIAAVVLSLIVVGNAYIIKVRSKSGRVVQLWWAPHTLIEPRRPADGSLFVSHYDYQPLSNGLVVPLAIEDVIHIRDGLDPRNPTKGLSKLASALREIYTDEIAANWTASLLTNAGVPGLVIAPKGAVRSEDAKEVKNRVEQQLTGDGRGKSIVMEGPTDVTQFGFSPDQMKLGDIRDIPEERVSALIGVPAAVVGFGAGLQSTKVGATMAELVDLAWSNGVLPRMRLIAAELTEQLLSEFEDGAGDDVEFAFNTSQVPIMADYHLKVAQRHKELVTGGIERKVEARRAVGLKPGPRDDVYLHNAGVQELDATKKPTADAPQPVAANSNGNGNGSAHAAIAETERVA